MLPQPGPGVLFQPLPDGAVLLDTASEVYFGLNSVGARIWQLLQPAGHTVDDLCTALGAEFPEVDPARLRKDVSDLLASLASEGLVFPAETRDAAPLAGHAA